MLDEHSFNSGSVQINYAEGPVNGPPLVLLHGLSARWQSFLPILPKLSDRWHIFAPEFRGHGASSHVAESYKWTTYSDDSAAFLTEIVKEPAILLGHSLGGMISVSLAAHVPQIVRAIMLEDPPLFSYRHLRSTPEMNLAAWRDLAAAKLPLLDLERALAELQPNQPPAVLAARVDSLSRLDPATISMTLDRSATDGFEIEQLLPRVDRPALLFRGSSALGGAISDDDLRQSIAMAPSMKVVEMPEVGHLMHLVQPDLFCAHLQRFLDEVV